MCCFSMITALFLNMKIRGRGFSLRSISFRVLSAGGGRVDLEMILQRDGLLNAAITTLGGQKSGSSRRSSWAMFWAGSSRSGAYGFTP